MSDVQRMPAKEYLEYLQSLLDAAKAAECTEDDPGLAKLKSFVATTVWNLERLDAWVYFSMAVTPVISAVEAASNGCDPHSINWQVYGPVIEAATRMKTRICGADSWSYTDYLAILKKKLAGGLHE
ncbi:MAG: hypothetical protein IKO41_21405 [Lachnospiraceae bacterium]|nr:hypothetical protein [Lachnospiraceae bacterium]